MKIKLIYPRWPKLKNQPEFNLPPHGPVCFAATLPKDAELSFCDENVEELGFDDDADLLCLSVMLTCQIPRAWGIADQYRSMGKKVLFGGIATMLHSQKTLEHADSLFLGEAEGRMEGVLQDFKEGCPRGYSTLFFIATPKDLTIRSNSAESLLVLSTSISLALMSSRAATAIF